MPNMIGKTILHYKIIEKLGSPREKIALGNHETIQFYLSHREMAPDEELL